MSAHVTFLLKILWWLLISGRVKIKALVLSARRHRILTPQPAPVLQLFSLLPVWPFLSCGSVLPPPSFSPGCSAAPARPLPSLPVLRPVVTQSSWALTGHLYKMSSHVHSLYLSCFIFSPFYFLCSRQKNWPISFATVSSAHKQCWT